MRLLLTSAGIKNPSIEAALRELLGKPVSEASALCVPTASYGMRNGALNAWKYVTGREPQTPMVELGWRSVGLLELTALPSLDHDHWVPLLRETDVLLVGGGDPVGDYDEASHSPSSQEMDRRIAEFTMPAME